MSNGVRPDAGSGADRAGRAVRVTVPASSANLGPGFDALGLALGLYDVVEARLSASGVAVRADGEGAATVPCDETHLVVRAVHAAWARLGFPAAGGTPGLELVCRNAIPHARGLGSSAAAIIAGVAVGYALAGHELDSGALQLAAEFEGHADNAAASLLGGLVVAWSDDTAEGPAYHAVKLDVDRRIRPVALVPAEESATKVTRGLLPAKVPHADAAFTAGRAALAVHAFTADPDLLLAATADRLHQDYRKPAWPATATLVGALRAAGVPAMVSGAGPTVLALPAGGELPAEVDVTGFSVLPLEIDRAGVRVESIG